MSKLPLDASLSVEDARSMVVGLVRETPVERIDIDLSLGRVLAQDVASDIDIAAFDKSAMDGFAVRHEDVKDARAGSPVSLDIVAHIGAGSVYESLVEAGQAVRIMTGAPLPDGADTVIRIEDTQVVGESPETPAGRIVLIENAPRQGAHIRPRGEEARAGEVLMRAGDCITPAGIGLLAGTGTVEVAVRSRPRVAVLSTGSELVDACEVPGLGQIRDSNSHALAAYVRDAGATATVVARVKDTREALMSALESVVPDHDLIVLTGGAAEGDFDHTSAVVRERGEVLFSKVNMRPGKAQTLGVIDGVPIFGLPGNPAAAAVVFEILVRPALRRMQGFADLLRPVVTARITATVKKREPFRLYMRARLIRDEAGELTVTPSDNRSPSDCRSPSDNRSLEVNRSSSDSRTPADNRSPSIFASMYGSNCLLVVAPEDTLLQPGDSVQCVCINVPEGEVF